MWKVVLADDEPFVREGLKELIPWEELGFSLEGCFRNGREILEKMPEIHPDLVILDIQMPVLDGLETARIISEEWPETTVILLTAYSEFQYAKKAIDYRVSSYVMKHNVLEDLPEVLTKMREHLEEIHSDEQGKMKLLQLLVYESEYMDPVQEGNDRFYSWFEEHFHNFRLLVIRGSMEGKEKGEAAKREIQEQIRRAFVGWEIQVLTVSVMEYVVLINMNDKKAEELKECCRNLMYSSKGSLLLAANRGYEGIGRISRAYREVRNYLNTHFLNRDDNEPNFILTDRESASCEKNQEEDLVSRTRAFVEKNFARKLTLEDVAGAVYVNRNYLSRIYKQKTGENLFDTINRRRIEEAKRLIREGRMKIREIADAVGVEDTAYFSKMFKKYTGYSPREYERTLKE